MKSKSIAVIQWALLLVAVVSWASYFMTGEGWVPLVVGSSSSVLFGIMFMLELFD